MKLKKLYIWKNDKAHNTQEDGLISDINTNNGIRTKFSDGTDSIAPLNVEH